LVVKGDDQTEQRKLQKNTMKTDKNSQTITTSGTLLQPEQAVSDNNTKKGSVYHQITQRIVALLAKGTISWRKPWDVQIGLPRNLISKKAYRGINVFLLHAMGYESGFWLTYRQAQALGGNIRRGEKGCPVVFWKERLVENEQSGEQEKIPLLRFYHVFNVAQCEGLRKLDAIQEIPVPNPVLPQRIVDGMPNRPEIRDGMRAAFYSPAGDFVAMPNRESFENAEEYFATLFHELIHATGHSSRLNRSTLAAAGSSSTPYCKEELIAEMGASFLCGRAQILEKTIQNSAAYVQGWIQLLQNDKSLLVKAAAQAQKAADYILGTQKQEGEDHE
jgi:antirestriction protein ArdC